MQKRFLNKREKVYGEYVTKQARVKTSICLHACKALETKIEESQQDLSSSRIAATKNEQET